MKQTLQRKFVRTAMTAVTALLLVLLVVINLANWYLVNQQTDHMLQTVLQSDHAPDIAGQPGQMGPRRSPGWREVLPQDMQEDIQETARHRILSMLALSAGGVALCWLGMLALVRVLARKAIEPVAVSMEKQRQFVTNAGHELKTPLAIILANTEAMELYQGESKWSRNIRAQTVRLSQLTQTLLTLARMEEGADLPPAETVDLSQLAEQALSAFQEAAALQTLTLRGQRVPPGEKFPCPAGGGGRPGPVLRAVLPGGPRPQPENRRLRHRPGRRPGHRHRLEGDHFGRPGGGGHGAFHRAVLRKFHTLFTDASRFVYREASFSKPVLRFPL